MQTGLPLFTLSVLVMLTGFVATGTITIQTQKTMQNNTIIDQHAEQAVHTKDHSDKRVLARGCDPELSRRFAAVVPPRIGNAEYIPTTDDADFIEKLKTEKWSVIFFAPGACRFSAAKRQIPGGNLDTQGWTLEQYEELVRELQGEDIKLVQTPFESKAIELLNKALDGARAVR